MTEKFFYRRILYLSRKLLIAIVIMLTFLAIPLFGAEQVQEHTADYVTRIQNEISADIGRLRTAIETQLEGFSLTSSDISRRIAELSSLTQKSSDDMAAWGYTPEQRETHTRILS